MEDIFEEYRTKNGEIYLGDQYLILKKIGHGAFGDVYMVRCSKTGNSMAVKIERTSPDSQTWSLLHEFSVYKKLNGGFGFPEVYGVYEDAKFHWLIMQLLGSSLNDLLPRCNKRFSIKTTLMLADQLLERVEYVHRMGFIHRDIKPSNLMMGLGNASQRLYMVDFGLAKSYRNTKTGVHIQFKRNRPMAGTIGYNSINAMRGFEQSRRDDMEGIGYVLIYLAKAHLPWHRIKTKTSSELRQKVLEVKERTTLEDLCSGLPDAFLDYMKYARNLEFGEKPDYNMLRDLFRMELRDAGDVNDLMFDWIQLEESRRIRSKSTYNNRRNKPRKVTRKPNASEKNEKENNIQCFIV